MLEVTSEEEEAEDEREDVPSSNHPEPAAQQKPSVNTENTT
ncbi:MAG: hypothetical protein OXC62_07240 [Aestuariivita sp.]|nr:hypothetical protein [Aestuariivita sp.]